MPSTAAHKRSEVKAAKTSSILIISGLSLMGLSLIFLLYLLYPVLNSEVGYYLFPPNKNIAVESPENKVAPSKKVLVPVDTSFGIVIPKIGANAKIIPNINPYNETEYQWALTKGVAHARGTVFPGQVGNVFLFSHSSSDLWIANRYNSIFYLVDKLVPGDEIYLFYKNEKFKYQVISKKIVDATSVQYLSPDNKDKIVTLMTCWPAGTTFKRLVVIAKISS